MIVADDRRIIEASTSRVRRFTSILVHTTDFGQYTEIALQGAPNREYTLGLFIENEELELQMQDQVWTPAQRTYVPCFFTKNAR